jgi:hypothetical protein
MDWKRSIANQGFTRVSVLLGVALAVAVVLLFHTPTQKRQPAARAVALDTPLQEALQDALSIFIRSKLVQTAVPCADPLEYFQSHLYLRHFTGSLGQVRATPPEGIAAKVWGEVFQNSMAAGSFAGAALSRCSLSILGTGGRFHFCLNVERDGRAPPGSFLQAPFIFAEVSVQLQDMRTGQRLSCAQFLEPTRSSAGASVDYSLFTIQDKGGTLELVKDHKRFSLRR